MRTNCARIAELHGNRTTRSRKDRQRGRKSGDEQEFTDSATIGRKAQRDRTKMAEKVPNDRSISPPLPLKLAVETAKTRYPREGVKMSQITVYTKPACVACKATFRAP